MKMRFIAQRYYFSARKAYGDAVEIGPAGGHRWTAWLRRKKVEKRERVNGKQPAARPGF